MNNQNLIIYQLPTLYQILKELDIDLNFNIVEVENEELLRNKKISWEFLRFLENSKDFL